MGNWILSFLSTSDLINYGRSFLILYSVPGGLSRRIWLSEELRVDQSDQIAGPAKPTCSYGHRVIQIKSALRDRWGFFLFTPIPSIVDKPHLNLPKIRANHSHADRFIWVFYRVFFSCVPFDSFFWFFQLNQLYGVTNFASNDLFLINMTRIDKKLRMIEL